MMSGGDFDRDIDCARRSTDRDDHWHEEGPFPISDLFCYLLDLIYIAVQGLTVTGDHGTSASARVWRRKLGSGAPAQPE